MPLVWAKVRWAVTLSLSNSSQSDELEKLDVVSSAICAAEPSDGVPMFDFLRVPKRE
jgi:hypothetical protein